MPHRSSCMWSWAWFSATSLCSYPSHTHGSSQRLRTEETAWEDEETKEERRKSPYSKERRVSFFWIPYSEVCRGSLGHSLQSSLWEQSKRQPLCFCLNSSANMDLMTLKTACWINNNLLHRKVFLLLIQNFLSLLQYILWWLQWLRNLTFQAGRKTQVIYYDFLINNIRSRCVSIYVCLCIYKYM